MPIPQEFRGRSIYHFTHIDNLRGLLATGLLANNHPNFPATAQSIAEAGIQERRSTMRVTCGPGGVVHDYVPLYFGSVSPMLLGVINKKNVDQMDILYLEFPIELIEAADVVFTSASANTLQPPTFYSDPADLSRLDWQAIDSLKWGGDDDFRHRRMAEILVHERLPLTRAHRIVVWNDGVRARVAEVLQDAGVQIPIEFESPSRRHWFNNFQENSRASLVMGPREIRMHFDAAIEAFSQRPEVVEDAEFETPRALLEGLRVNFGCISETAELVGLRSANGMHRHTVDVHTQQVVQRLLELDEFAEFPTPVQARIELAAYLHDIGKGPKSRWAESGGLQKVDPNHPVKSLGMLVDILTTRVKKVKLANARFIALLVCYHDLVGEVLGKGRNESQIVAVAASEEELRALFAIGKADATSLQESWWDDEEASALFDRCLAEIEGRAL